ncbi:cache domain-containing protein [Marinomonas algicola]|uniref:bifunctional diguanylate cyclase/phosphodiesterase n=1 Tax=Marinomonas algicola TaxID=2773454 RepID=UPI00174C3B5A|nr:cache domain-containing protein [Marinomonas algicola]
MASLDNKQLLNLIRYAPVVVVFVFALAVSFIAIHNHRELASQSIKNLREELILQRKETIRSEVHQVYKHLMLEKSQIESDLKEKAKQRVYEAYSIANYIYAQNIDKSKEEISQLIIEALRPARFFNERGYFFIINDDGNTVLNGQNAYLENQNTWYIQDSAGNFIMRDMLEVTKNNDEGFLRWRFKKPDSVDNREFDKVGYIKKFEPYNWSIATGEYVSDYESDVKQELLKGFSDYEYGDDGYFFVLDSLSGTLLAQHDNDFLGLDFIIGEKIPKALFLDFKSIISNGGGYVRYSKPLTLSGEVVLEQENYVKEVKEWNWIIATGFSLKAFERHLSLKEAQLATLNQKSLVYLVALAFVALFLLTVTSLFVGGLIARRFEMFQSRIKDDFQELNNTKNNMEYMALHDALTGLPNRVLMLRYIKENIEKSEASEEMLAVLFVDLDNFKNVNDLYGHHVGDLLLASVSQRFTTLVHDDCCVFRFGGDEFVFCFTKLSRKKDAEEKVKLVQASMMAPIFIEGKTLYLGCSIGVSLYPDDSRNADALIRQADTVLYKSKSEKKGQALFYSNHISVQMERKMLVQQELALAIDCGELTVHYQPQIDVVTGKVVSVEALVRWGHANLGNIYPDEFIPIAEETGMIHKLDMYVFKRSCEDIFRLSPNGKESLKLSVNISPTQLLEQDFSSHIFGICKSVGIDTKRITLELTENIFIHGLEIVQPVLSQLRGWGFGFSLDDFGTGYSSLSYLNSLSLTEIKIDRSFISKFLENHQSDMLVRMIIGIGGSCDLTVVAEGVETAGQFHKLSGYHCDLVQGYYFYRPLTLSGLSEVVLTGSSMSASN